MLVKVISKEHFGILNSSKKRIWKFKLCQKHYIRFLEELKKTKSPFEINWPLPFNRKYDGESFKLWAFEERNIVLSTSSFPRKFLQKFWSKLSNLHIFKKPNKIFHVFWPKGLRSTRKIFSSFFERYEGSTVCFWIFLTFRRGFKISWETKWILSISHTCNWKTVKFLVGAWHTDF